MKVSNPQFFMNVEFVKENWYVRTSDILRNIGSRDSVTSLINNVSSGGGAEYGDLYRKIKARGRFGNAFYFNIPEFKTFLANYNPRGEEKIQVWKEYKSWAINVIKDLEFRTQNITSTKQKEVPKPKKEPISPKPKEKLLTLTEAAKMMNIGVKKDFVPFLLKNRAVYRLANKALLPHQQEIISKRLTVVEVQDKYERKHAHTRLTQKGFKYWKNKYLESIGGNRIWTKDLPCVIVKIQEDLVVRLLKSFTKGWVDIIISDAYQNSEIRSVEYSQVVDSLTKQFSTRVPKNLEEKIKILKEDKSR